MTHSEKIVKLIELLKKEMPEYATKEIPTNEEEQWNMLRGLFNVRPAYPLTTEFITLQDEVLQKITIDKGITDVKELEGTKLDPRFILWKGDITSLKADVIVNAANNHMEGCWVSGHNCIDNNIHSFAGCQMRIECHREMFKLKMQYGDSYVQPTAVPMITSGYNLPAKQVIHIVGPVVDGPLSKTHRDELAQCYRASLELAQANRCQSIAFCCISTGVFNFPHGKAAQIAVRTVKKWIAENPESTIQKVVFNVFEDEDYQIYNTLLNKKIKN
ncbi:putative ADP-ribose binding module [Lachnospiraceae bacterium TWA4]|nr:putative ADP-ribose binding module [Lachnospiraceae bacterium TWA4]